MATAEMDYVNRGGGGHYDVGEITTYSTNTFYPLSFTPKTVTVEIMSDTNANGIYYANTETGDRKVAYRSSPTGSFTVGDAKTAGSGNGNIEIATNGFYIGVPNAHWVGKAYYVAVD